MGDIVSKASVVEANKLLALEGKEPAQYTQLLLGITKVSIWSDSGYQPHHSRTQLVCLSTLRLAGRADRLHGLKENVIIGRKIPVGTGARTGDESVEDDYAEADIAEDVELAA
jgi:DNA-directed RNA polymerase subunit beta'